MGKVQKKTASDKIRKKKSAQDIKLNPFEVKINKQKFSVFGRKRKHDRGLPGVSRSKSIKRRTETLLKEYRNKGKANTFIDKRFGEYDTRITEDEKMAKRFSLEQKRIYTKKSIYNLNEDDELTHYGQSLADIESFTNRPDSDSETEEKGKLSAEFTAAAHFGGGGLLQKKVSSKTDEEEQKPKSRKEFIEELIMKSKKEKRERQMQRDKAQELTEKLDNDWKEIHSLLAHQGPKMEQAEEKPKAEDYDIIVRQLFFDVKAQPSDRLKTKEELAKEEKECLQKLEMARLRRMRGDFEGKSRRRPKHMSADALNDGFILDKVDKPCLVYKDGMLEQLEEEVGDENELENRKYVNGKEDEEGNHRKKDEDDLSDEGDDGHFNLSSTSESTRGAGGKGAFKSRPSEAKAPNDEESKALIEAAKKELPFIFSVPKSYEDLKSLLAGQSSEEQSLIVERIWKCNHPSLAEGNKSKLENFFGLLWTHVGKLATRHPPELNAIDKMVPHIYDLSQMFPEASCSLVQSTLRQSMQEVEDQMQSKGWATYPTLDKLLYLKFTGALFPTSDFRHAVVTPALVHLSQLVTKCSVSSLREVAAGLFMCCLFLDFVSFSKRFVPEVINFLLGILHLAVPNKESLGYAVVPPFKAAGKSSNLLLLKDKEAAESWEMKPLPMSLMHETKPQDELRAAHIKFSCMAMCFNLCKRCCSMYRELPAFQEIIHPLEVLLTLHLPMNDYPPQLQELYHEVLKEIKDRPSCYRPLAFEKKKPALLKFYTPKLVEITEYGKKRGSTEQERERLRLIHKHKREFKGAIREIRKDAQFLARHKFSDIVQRDSERKRKVKMLMNSLATQEGDWKALKRKKRKM